MFVCRLERTRLRDILQKASGDDGDFILACLAYPLRILGDGRGGADDKGNALVNAVADSPAQFTDLLPRGFIVAGAKCCNTQHLPNTIRR